MSLQDESFPPLEGPVSAYEPGLANADDEAVLGKIMQWTIFRHRRFTLEQRRSATSKSCVVTSR